MLTSTSTLLRAQLISSFWMIIYLGVYNCKIINRCMYYRILDVGLEEKRSTHSMEMSKSTSSISSRMSVLESYEEVNDVSCKGREKSV